MPRAASTSSTRSDAGLSAFAYDPSASAGSGKNLTQKVAAQDAQLTIDGIPVAKPSNTITDAIEGVTLNLLQPAFVVSVGDLIEGYTKEPAKLTAEWKEFDAYVALCVGSGSLHA